ncbi:MAG TPA: amidohydrolase family protein [Acidimicrobiales bacterium]|jgi:N-acyl-D-aspartate/D-glutamate deacylase|nr:amidohydrolase family protein [Acidimicrobiales bacterium]
MHDLVIRNAVVVDGTGAPSGLGDVAVDGGVISEVTAAGEAGAGRRHIAADGLAVLPGWVDIHTHYDGQATWDPEMTPSSWHGVTTVVMGNCGVGFAPVRPESHEFLIELMEGVEDIPGTALHEGISWDWETFPEYLDALDRTPRVMDVAAQVPHAAVRAYVLGERAHDDATPDEVAEMAAIVREGLDAGAVGFSTSRTILHRSVHGLVPGTAAPAEELLTIGDALGEAGHGVFEVVSDTAEGGEERAWMVELSRRSGARVTYGLAQKPWDPTGYRSALADARALAADGVKITPQVSCRPTGLLFGLQSSLHPFITHEAYRQVADLPLAERVAALKDPELRQRLLDDGPGTDNMIALALMSRWEQMFPLGDPPDYEPAPSKSVAAVAARDGRKPEAVALELLLEQDGTALLFAPLASYVDCDFEAIREMITDDSAVLGLSDGGAHCGLICDASMPTFLLTHWVRDRARGPRLGLEQAVHLQTGRTAAAFGLADRGVIAPGLRADLNIVDLSGLHLHAPKMAHDLPAGGRRLTQRADGYKFTLVAGEVTFEDGEPTGLRPGRLVRA